MIVNFLIETLIWYNTCHLILVTGVYMDNGDGRSVQLTE